MSSIESWGRLGRHPHQLSLLKRRDEIASQLVHERNGLPFGNGRSYGDVCLNPGGRLWDTRSLNRFIDLDESSGLLQCEAGVLLGDIQQLLIPRGWILPVTPGTQFVTVGGAIANDVHGKSHHVTGSFAHHVVNFTLMRTDGETLVCSPTQNKEWFAATVGGLGLTGIIVSATLQLKRVAGPWLDTQTIAYDGLEDFFTLSDESKQDWEHTVSWIDCMSKSARGLFMRGNYSASIQPCATSKKRLRVPLTPPVSMINRLSLPILNKGYYALKSRDSSISSPLSLEHYQSFFYPLDGILQWNRIYGPKGFYQYQCVIPSDARVDATKELLQAIASSKEGSFLAVLKTFGESPPLGMLSFPMPGVTLALDFPNKGVGTNKLFERLDSIVMAAGGRLYAAKDARMPRTLFEQGYPQLSSFLSYRDIGISSALSRRLIGY